MARQRAAGGIGNAEIEKTEGCTIKNNGESTQRMVPKHKPSRVQTQNRVGIKITIHGVQLKRSSELSSNLGGIWDLLSKFVHHQQAYLSLDYYGLDKPRLDSHSQDYSNMDYILHGNRDSLNYMNYQFGLLPSGWNTCTWTVPAWSIGAWIGFME